MNQEPKKAEAIKEGMEVETAQTDGEQIETISTVKEVHYNEEGKVDHVVVEKGVFIRRELTIPAEQVQEIDVEQGKIIVKSEESK